MGEILKVAAAAAAGSYLGGMIAPVLVSKFAPAGGLSTTTGMLIDLAISGLTAGVIYKFLKI